jgi:class 3 adenylate cyclase
MARRGDRQAARQRAQAVEGALVRPRVPAAVNLRGLSSIAVLPGDDDDERIRKSTLTVLTCTICALTPFWVGTYLALDLPVSAAIPLAYLVVSVGSLVGLARSKRFRSFRTTQLGLILALPFLLQWSLGGFEASSGVSLWALTSSLGALMFTDVREATRWFAAYLVLLAVSIGLEPALEPADIPAAIRIAFFGANVTGVSLTAYLVLRYFVREREREHARSERLLLNVLPAPIARRLKREEGVVADRFPEATVLFADIVDFTPLSSSLPAERVVELLDRVFTVFDGLADAHGLEKIKTIGDAYMVAGGIPVPREDHCEAIADMALAMLSVCASGLSTDVAITLRVGIDTGPVVAGVIGRSKFIYDLWGDTVNTASRMESHGVPNSIQVTRAVYERLRDGYLMEPRGTIDVKGKGPMPTWLLLGARAERSA